MGDVPCGHEDAMGDVPRDLEDAVGDVPHSPAVAKRPRIGLTLMLDAPEAGFPSPRYSMSRAYFAAIRAAGGVPVALVPGALEELDLYLSPQGVSRVPSLALDGLCLTGGGDLDPRYYGAERHEACQEPDRERDSMEYRILDLIARSSIPVLAICRGFQILNAFHGGTLCQDLAVLRRSAFKHDYFRGFPRDMLAHEVRIEPGSALGRIVGSDPLPVNSFHHQAVDEIAPGWRATAWSADGLIEAMEPVDRKGPAEAGRAADRQTGKARSGAGSRPSRDEGFLLALQWHPECLTAYARHRAVFAAFVAAAQRYRERSLNVPG